jgi:hypothetical protein
MHVRRDDHLLGALERLLLALQELRDDSGHVAGVIEHRIRHLTHQAARATAIDQADAVGGHQRAKAARRIHKGRIGAGAGAAIDADCSNRAHGGGCGIAFPRASRRGARSGPALRRNENRRGTGWLGGFFACKMRNVAKLDCNQSV